MGKYFGSELTSSKADIYNKSSIVRCPDNYSGDGLKQTRAWNRHIVAFYWSSVLCVNELCKRKTQRCLQSKRPGFTGINWVPTMCVACATAACVLAFVLIPASPPGRCPRPREACRDPPDPQHLAFASCIPLAPRICYRFHQGWSICSYTHVWAPLCCGSLLPLSFPWWTQTPHSKSSLVSTCSEQPSLNQLTLPCPSPYKHCRPHTRKQVSLSPECDLWLPGFLVVPLLSEPPSPKWADGNTVHV